MADRPIPFSGPMIRALLAGTKTQTRRVISTAPKRTRVNLFDGTWTDSYVLDPGNRSWLEEGYLWRIGDRLWVKETYRIRSWDEDGAMWVTYSADEVTSRGLDAPDEFSERLCSRLDKAKVRIGEDGMYTDIPPALLSRPSIFMPRWASRITLAVTEVRVQRLQDISEEDAIAEGCRLGVGNETSSNAVFEYASLWDHINGKRPGCVWADNPWIVAVSFTVERRNIDEAA